MGAAFTYMLEVFGYPLPGVVSWTYLQLLCIVYVWALVCTPFCMWVLTVRVDGTAIEARTFWGRKRRVAAADITELRRRGPGPIGFWIVRDRTSQPPLWISRALRKAGPLKALLNGKE
jgi:hypothetical protein